MLQESTFNKNTALGAFDLKSKELFGSQKNRKTSTEDVKYSMSNVSTGNSHIVEKYSHIENQILNTKPFQIEEFEEEEFLLKDLVTENNSNNINLAETPISETITEFQSKITEGTEDEEKKIVSIIASKLTDKSIFPVREINIKIHQRKNNLLNLKRKSK